MYNYCLNVSNFVKNTSYLLNKLESYGYWPLLHGNKWNINSYDLTALLNDISQNNSADYLFTVSVGSDMRNITHAILEFDQVEFEKRSYDILNDNKQALNNYKEYIIKTIQLLASDVRITLENNYFTHSIDEMIEFEKKFTKILIPKEELRDFDKSQFYKFSELKKNVDQVFVFLQFYSKNSKFRLIGMHILKLKCRLTYTTI